MGLGLRRQAAPRYPKCSAGNLPGVQVPLTWVWICKCIDILHTLVGSKIEAMITARDSQNQLNKCWEISATYEMAFVDDDGDGSVDTDENELVVIFPRIPVPINP